MCTKKKLLSLVVALYLERGIIVNAAVAILRGQKLQGVAYLEDRFKVRYYGIATRLVLLRLNSILPYY